MDPTPYFIMGMLTGTGGLLLIQAYARRTARKALAASQLESQAVRAGREQAPEQAMVSEMRRRVEVLEKIVTEQPLRLEREIERLR